MEEAASALLSRCQDLVIKIGILNSDAYASLPLTRYILSVPCAIPVEHVILAERPYATDIFPYAASAMSYDPDLQQEVTPMVHFLALDISNGSNLSYDTVKDWFRDSWKYLSMGILLLNVCSRFGFMDNRSERERVAMEEFIRDVVSVSLRVSNKRVHMYALGNPARHSAGRIRSSIVEFRGRVTIHECKSPAGFKHRVGDKMSPEFTMGAKAFTRLLASLVSSTLEFNNCLTSDNYVAMSSGSPDLNRLIEKATSSSNSFKAISAYFKANTGKTVDRNDELFDRAAEEMTEFVMALSASKIKLLFAQISEPQGASKPAYFNSRPNYNRTSYSKGSSSRASVHTPGKKQSVGFGDDDVAEKPSNASSSVATPVDARSASSVPQTPKAPYTPTPARGPTSIAGQSSAARRTVSLGFVDSDSDTEAPSAKVGTEFNTAVSDDELNDLSLVSDFIDPTNGNYDVESAVIELIQESIRTRRAMSDTSREVLTIIRDTRSSPGRKSISNALGYDDDIQDMPSPIMQWILKNVIGSK